MKIRWMFSVMLMVVGFVILFPTSIYGQVSVTDGGTYVENQFVGETEQEDKNPLNSLIDSIVNEGIAVSASIIGMGLSYLFFWLRKKGIEITPQQEKMFKELLTNRYKKLAKDSWKTFRADETKFTDALREGRIPNDLATILTSNGKEFAEELLKKNEFKDFAKNLAEGTVDKLLEDIRTDLKNENQKRMLDILPKICLDGKNSIYNIASGQNLTNKEIVSKIQEIIQCKLEVNKDAKKYSFLPISIKLIQKEFNFKPRSVLEKFDKIISAYQNKTYNI